MREAFEEYLIRRGYKVTTSSGQPSTVYDYIRRIDYVCDLEGCGWAMLAAKIGSVVARYDIGGDMEDHGNIGHRSVINALKRFKEFIRGEE